MFWIFLFLFPGGRFQKVSRARRLSTPTKSLRYGQVFYRRENTKRDIWRYRLHLLGFTILGVPAVFFRMSRLKKTFRYIYVATKEEARAIGVSHTAYQDEFRWVPRSQSWRRTFYFIFGNSKQTSDESWRAMGVPNLMRDKYISTKASVGGERGRERPVTTALFRISPKPFITVFTYYGGT